MWFEPDTTRTNEGGWLDSKLFRHVGNSIGGYSQEVWQRDRNR